MKKLLICLLMAALLFPIFPEKNVEASTISERTCLRYQETLERLYGRVDGLNKQIEEYTEMANSSNVADAYRNMARTLLNQFKGSRETSLQFISNNLERIANECGEFPEIVDEVIETHQLYSTSLMNNIVQDLTINFSDFDPNQDILSFLNNMKNAIERFDRTADNLNVMDRKVHDALGKVKNDRVREISQNAYIRSPFLRISGEQVFHHVVSAIFYERMYSDYAKVNPEFQDMAKNAADSMASIYSTSGRNKLGALSMFNNVIHTNMELSFSMLNHFNNTLEDSADKQLTKQQFNQITSRKVRVSNNINDSIASISIHEYKKEPSQQKKKLNNF